MTAVPRVSVVMPVYNAGVYLRATLDSILTQTFTDLELVAVDDGSTDGSAAVLDAYAARDARVVIVRHTVNQGVVAALNHGLAAARGEYVARQDSDDLSLPERLAAQVALLDREPQVGLVSCWVDVIDSDGRLTYLNFFSRSTANADIQTELLRFCTLCAGSVLLRHTVLDQVGNFTPEVETSEDYDMWLRIAEVSELACVPQVLFQYRHHAASLSNTRRTIQSLAEARSLEWAIYRRHGPQPTDAALRPAAQLHLKSAEYHLRQADWPALAERVSYALRLCPPLADDPEVYLPLPPGPTGAAVLAEVFRQLPPTSLNRRRYRRRLAQHHMRAAFEAARRGDRAAAAADILAGLRYDASWLRNRGVLVILARGLLARRRPTDNSQQDKSA